MKMMLQRGSSSSSTTSPPAVLATATGEARPSPWQVNQCRFCARTFRSCYALSAHYNVHKRDSKDRWIRFGPKQSRIRREILRALKLGKEYVYTPRSCKRTGQGRRGRPRRDSSQLPRPNDGGESSQASRPLPVQGPSGLPVLRPGYGQLSTVASRRQLGMTRPVGRIQARGNSLHIGGAMVTRERADVGPPPGFLVRNISAEEYFGPRPRTMPPTGPERAPAPALMNKYGVSTIHSESLVRTAAPSQLPAVVNPSKGIIIRDVATRDPFGPQPKMKLPTKPVRDLPPTLMNKYGLPKFGFGSSGVSSLGLPAAGINQAIPSSSRSAPNDGPPIGTLVRNANAQELFGAPPGMKLPTLPERVPAPAPHGFPGGRMDGARPSPDGRPPSSLIVRNVSAEELFGPRPKTELPTALQRGPSPALRKKYGLPTVELKSSSAMGLTLGRDPNK